MKSATNRVTVCGRRFYSGSKPNPKGPRRVYSNASSKPIPTSFRMGNCELATTCGVVGKSPRIRSRLILFESGTGDRPQTQGYGMRNRGFVSRTNNPHTLYLCGNGIRNPAVLEAIDKNRDVNSLVLEDLSGEALNGNWQAVDWQIAIDPIRRLHYSRRARFDFTNCISSDWRYKGRTLATFKPRLLNSKSRKPLQLRLLREG